MPAGSPVATFAIGNAGASNEALFAAALLAVDHADVAESLSAFRQRQSDEVARNDDPRVPVPSGRAPRGDTGRGPAGPQACLGRYVAGAVAQTGRETVRERVGDNVWNS